MNTRWALTQRSLPDNRLIKIGGWALTQGWALARDNTVLTCGGDSQMPMHYVHIHSLLLQGEAKFCRQLMIHICASLHITA